MEPRLSLITLGVADLERSKRFYGDVFGWMPFQDNGGIVMYKLNGLILTLYPQHALMDDAQVEEKSKGSRFTLAQCLRSTGEVDALFAELKKNVIITKEPVKVFWGGYSGYFADPVGHLWEIAHSPFLEMDGEGNVPELCEGQVYLPFHRMPHCHYPDADSSRPTSFKSTIFDSPANKVGPRPMIRGCSTNSYSSIKPSSVKVLANCTPPTPMPLPGCCFSCQTKPSRSPHTSSAFRSTAHSVLLTTYFPAASMVFAKGIIHSGCGHTTGRR